MDHTNVECKHGSKYCFCGEEEIIVGWTEDPSSDGAFAEKIDWDIRSG